MPASGAPVYALWLHRSMIPQWVDKQLMARVRVPAVHALREMTTSALRMPRPVHRLCSPARTRAACRHKRGLLVPG